MPQPLSAERVRQQQQQKQQPQQQQPCSGLESHPWTEAEGLAADVSRQSAVHEQYQEERSPGGQRCRYNFIGEPPREVSLSVWHRRSSPLGLANTQLERGLDASRRLDALEWLVQAFDALGLPDGQLFAAFGLLDRYAAASPVPISAGPGAFALVLAAMLVALKVSGTQKDLERAKRLVVEVSGNSKPWTEVRRAELQILRCLGFRACTPTARELLDRLLYDSAAEISKSSTGDADVWDGESFAKYEALSRFLLELGVVHEPEAIYGPGRPPLVAALAALSLAQLALGVPRRCAEALQSPLRLLEETNFASSVPEVAEAMRQRWCQEERRAAGSSSSGGCSAVMEKWVRRVRSFGASPPAAGELQHLIAFDSPPAAAVVAKSSPSHGSCAARRVSVEVLSRRPTPARRRTSAPVTTGKAHALAALPDAGVVASPQQPQCVQLTQVLEMLESTKLNMTTGGSSASAPGAAGQAPSMTSVLVNAATQTLWPAAESSKVPTEAAVLAVREAAAILQEAAQAALDVATHLETDVVKCSQGKVLDGSAGSGSKRRRTFGGPSPVQPMSSTGALEEHNGVVRVQSTSSGAPDELIGVVQ